MNNTGNKDNENCIFCKILKGEIPSNKVFENDNFVAILDAFPANLGHTLIIPKNHYFNIFDIPEEILQEGHKIAKIVASSLKDILEIKDFNILQNNGIMAGQTVFHFHIHVIPRKENDKVLLHSKPIEIDEATTRQLIENLRNHTNNIIE